MADVNQSGSVNAMFFIVFVCLFVLEQIVMIWEGNQFVWWLQCLILMIEIDYRPTLNIFRNLIANFKVQVLYTINCGFLWQQYARHRYPQMPCARALVEKEWFMFVPKPFSYLLPYSVLFPDFVYRSGKNVRFWLFCTDWWQNGLKNPTNPEAELQRLCLFWLNFQLFDKLDPIPKIFSIF